MFEIIKFKNLKKDSSHGIVKKLTAIVKYKNQIFEVKIHNFKITHSFILDPIEQKFLFVFMLVKLNMRKVIVSKTKEIKYKISYKKIIN